MTALQSNPSPIMSDRDMAALGLQEVAYVKPVSTANGVAYAVHAADGTEIAVMANRDVAFAAIRQNDLRPVSVH
jgi:hypothetical protein